MRRPVGEIPSAAVWFTVPAVLSDLLLLPVVAVLGAVATRALAPWSRLPVQVAAVLIGTLLLIALPYLGRPGLRADNSTLLNRNYLAGYLVYVAIIAGGAVIWALVRRQRLRPNASRADGTQRTDR